MNFDGNCMVFTGGGTIGHVNPGLAVVEQLRKHWDGRIVWIGSAKELERRAVETAGVEFISISTGKFRRSLSLRNFIDIFRIAAGFFQSLVLLKRLKPALVFSKGGYVSVPPCAAARCLGIPYFTHESDVTPGLATRLNAPGALALFVSWQETLQHLKPAWRRKTMIAGNPVREAVISGNAERGRAFLGVPEGKPVLLALGGSQGAGQINELVSGLLDTVGNAWFIAHQTGNAHAPCRPADTGYKGFAFLHTELPDVYAAATVIIGRAGAGTIWEASAAGKPLILVPLCGSDTRGDQVDNTRRLVQAGAALGFVGESATVVAITQALRGLADRPALAGELVSQARGLMNPSAATAIAEVLIAQLKRTRNERT